MGRYQTAGACEPTSRLAPAREQATAEHALFCGLPQGIRRTPTRPALFAAIVALPRDTHLFRDMLEAITPSCSASEGAWRSCNMTPVDLMKPSPTTSLSTRAASPEPTGA